MNVSELNRHIIKELSPVLGDGEAKAAARIIWDDVLHYTPEQIIIRGDHELEAFTVENIKNIVRRVASGEPIQYVVGSARFMGLDLDVTPDTLIPRPETAGLVDLITDDFAGQSDLCVLDAGTGSGCIAIALARALKFPEITAIDISGKALDVARRNAARYKAGINFMLADILALPDSLLNRRFDIIVSNPPYVLDSEADEMEASVLDHEPKTALFVPDSNPLQFYRPLAEHAVSMLNSGGKIYFEINPKEATAIKVMLNELNFNDVEILRDYLGRERFAKAAI